MKIFHDLGFLLLVLSAIMVIVAISMVFLTFTWRKRLFEKNLILDRIKAEKDLEIAQTMFETQEKEREEIAKDLHDEIGSVLSLLKMNLSKKNSDFNKVNESLSLQNEMQLMDVVIDRIRTITNELTPSILLKFGLFSALQNHCSLINKSEVFTISCVQKNFDEHELTLSLKVNLFKILLELLNNITKHTSAKNVLIEFETNSNECVISISHDGESISQLNYEELKINSLGLGLKSIATRIAIMQAQLTFQNEAPQTSIKIPINDRR